MQKGSIALVFLIILALIIISGTVIYFLNRPRLNSQSIISPSQNVASETYTNSILGIELNYDKDLIVKEESEQEFNKRENGDFRKNFTGYIEYEPGKALGSIIVLNKDNSYETNPLTIWVFENPDNLSIDDWYQNYWYYPFVWGDFSYKGKTELSPKQEATISGKMGKSGIIDYRPGNPNFVYIANENKMYLFRVIGEKGHALLSAIKLTN